MNDSRGGDPDRIAPIIPLFGGSSKSSRQTPSSQASEDGSTTSPSGDGAATWRTTWDHPPAGRASVVDADAGTPSNRHPARGRRNRSGDSHAHPSQSAPRLRAIDATEGEGSSQDEPSPEETRATAEESLVRKLRARSLSIAEARQVLRGVGLDSETISDVIEDFCRRGYLDDAALAGVLVRSGVERKGQGRVALSRSLSQRGIPRDVIETALDELPDDDDERALEFARTKARSMSRLDPDAALRRLVGQLSRRGYNGAVSMKAAKAALREASFGGATSGVRFVDSD
ncbi:Regulatory protein RecX [Microbacterium oxydans]|uniref:Regulatory protein RecX n=1 Tax=Microbacterium oxydans TaxID=82380 RepID=A0A0F0KDH3_9MICO|nr:regulatory protein RecX [Microbacterium oxydans]KJL18474.1 Regulatory protein RecX [Microbacterium oxydans]